MSPSFSLQNLLSLRYSLVMLFATIDLNDPTSVQMPPLDFGAAFVKMFISLAILILLLFLLMWFVKKISQVKLEKANATQSIQILEKRVLSPKTLLYLVEIDGKKVLLAESHLEIKKLESFETKELE